MLGFRRTEASGTIVDYGRVFFRSKVCGKLDENPSKYLRRAAEKLESTMSACMFLARGRCFSLQGKKGNYIIALQVVCRID